MTKLPNLASKAAVGLAATVSSRERPCFLSAATLSRMATSMSRKSLSSALLLTALPWPAMMIVVVGRRRQIGVGCRDHPVDAAAGRIVDERIDAVPERVGHVDDVRLGESHRDVAVGVRRTVIFEVDRRSVELETVLARRTLRWEFRRPAGRGNCSPSPRRAGPGTDTCACFPAR